MSLKAVAGPVEDGPVTGSAAHGALPQKYLLLSMGTVAVMGGILVRAVLAGVRWISAGGRTVLLRCLSQGSLRRWLQSGASAEGVLGCCLPLELCSRQRSNWYHCTGCKYLFSGSVNLAIINLGRGTVIDSISY